MENKKTKLTVSGKPKKSYKNFDNKDTAGKKTVFIDKKPSKVFGKGFVNKTGGFKQSTSSFKKAPSLKNNISPKINTATSDFERRKLAEQRATKRLKGDTDNEKELYVKVLPKELDEEVASLMVKGFGGTITKLTQEQQDYISVNENGPFKGDSYSY